MKEINKLRSIILRASFIASEGHVPSAFSILDILYVLYKRVIFLDNGSDDRDRFILSKGHASLALYSVLFELGHVDEFEFDTFAKYDSRLGGHPDRNKIPFVEASTGSLGHGFPFGVGIAMALRAKRSTAHTYILIGDGESNEGTIWEAALIASNYKLNNLTVIVDYNHSNDRALSLGDLQLKFKSFGWLVLTIDGHDHDEIFNALTYRSNTCVMVIANTIKGKGIPDMENNPAWHHKSPTKEEYSKFLKILMEK